MMPAMGIPCKNFMYSSSEERAWDACCIRLVQREAVSWDSGPPGRAARPSWPQNVPGRGIPDRAVSDRGVPVRIKRPMASRLRLPDSAASPLDRAVEISFNI